MCEFLVGNRKCLIHSKNNKFCHIHTQVNLMQRISNQRKEIALLNAKLQEVNNILQIVERADYIKYKLTPISANKSFRQAIDDVKNKDYVEELFGVPQDKCIDLYTELLNKRNMITHKYTNRSWKESTKKTRHNKSVRDLCKSVKSYQLMKAISS